MVEIIVLININFAMDRKNLHFAIYLLKKKKTKENKHREKEINLWKEKYGGGEGENGGERNNGGKENYNRNL